jgi:broad specificity phosphatase PhoE
MLETAVTHPHSHLEPEVHSHMSNPLNPNAKRNRIHGLTYYEDPRLREVEFGYDEVEGQHERRKKHGWFYYRFYGGESPADCFDRTSSFLESMMRQVTRKGTCLSPLMFLKEWDPKVNLSNASLCFFYLNFQVLIRFWLYRMG